MKEFIICSAIYINDGEKHTDQPTNITTGFVISGRRHNNCYATIKSLKGVNWEEYLNLVDHTDEQQGFITSLNKYLNREDAFIMAKENNQLLFPKLYGKNQKNILTSECIFPTNWEDFSY